MCHFQVWTRALQTVETTSKGTKAKDLIIKRSGWKTVRIFVSSTFKDFHPEREVLVKKVSLLFLESSTYGYNFVTNKMVLDTQRYTSN